MDSISSVEGMELVKNPSDVPEIATWMNQVERGDVPAGRDSIALMAYLRRVFADEDIFVDLGMLDDFKRFDVLFPFDLFPWEDFALALFMCCYTRDRLPRWSDMLVLGGRGLGKTAFDAYVSLCAMSKAHGIRNYNVDICANTETQSKMTFDELKSAMETHEDVFSRSFKWTDTLIRSKSTGAEMHYWTNSPKNRDGLRPGMVIYDEVHGYQDWRNINVFETALGKTDNPRSLYSTTNGNVREGVLDSMTARAEGILHEGKPDNGFLPLIFKIDSEDEVHDERNWEKANPSLRYRPSLLAEIRKEYNNYLSNPHIYSDFMTKRMNLPAIDKDADITTWENIMATSKPLPDLRGCDCVCGIDFARSTDFISAALLFHVDGIYYVIHHSWWCTHSFDADLIKAPIGEWAQRCIVTIVDDVEISPSLITGWIQSMGELYEIKRIAIDDYRHTMFQRYLSEIGYSIKDKTVTRIRPSNLMKVVPLIDSVFANRQFVWGDDPCLRWMANNTKLETAPNGNYKYGKKERRSRKTDGFMALAAAMCIEDDIPIEPEELEFAPVLVF